MKTHHHRNILIALPFFLFFIIFYMYTYAPSVVFATDSELKTEGEIRGIILKWRDNLKSILTDESIKKIVNYAERYPVDVPDGTMPVTFTDSENNDFVNIKAVINRCDWAYAFEGWKFTLFGGTSEGYDNLIDVGFWCFIEAALIHLEPDHLVNIGFHLNNRWKYEDAKAILTYANHLNSNNHAIHNNLGHTLACMNDFKGATQEALKALALNPDNPAYKTKIETYSSKAGFPIKMPKMKTSDQGLEPPETNKALMSKNLMNAWAMITMEFAKYQNRSSMNFQKYAGQMNAEMMDDYARQDKYAREQQKCYDAIYDQRRYESLDEALCQCTVPQMRNVYASSVQCYYRHVNIYGEWSEADFTAYGEIVESVFKLADTIDFLNEKEKTELYMKICRQCHFFLQIIENNEAQVKIFAVHADGNFTMYKEAESKCSSALVSKEIIDPADYFGRRPTTIVLKRFDRGNGEKTWFLWLGAASLELRPDSTANLSLGISGIAAAKFSYNFKSRDFGCGVGVGLNLGKALGPAGKWIFKNAMKFELNAFIDSKKGPQAYIEAGMNPKIGAAYASVNDVVVTIEN